MKKLLVLGAVSASVLFCGCTGAGIAGQVAPAPNPDKLFIADTVQDASAEMQIGRLALERTSDPRVRRFAEQMISEHSLATDELIDIGISKGVRVRTDTGEPPVPLYSRMAQLQGLDFDREYMAHMVANHLRLLALLENRARTSSDPELRAWVLKNEPTARRHLEEARSIQLDLAR